LLSHQGEGGDPKHRLRQDWDQVMKTGQPKAALMDHVMLRWMIRPLSTGLRGSIGTFATVLFICAFLSDANAQNLIQNPGFENNPPTTYGNNIGWSISPWIVGTGQQPNVVKVDGPGGYDYGHLGPESDATAPGSGIPQHYLDIADGVNKFYQSFTVPACPLAPAGTTAKITFGGYFSGRADLGGVATIKLLNGTGFNGSVIATLTAVVAPGNSKTDPWIQVSGTATLVYGSTFSYVVDMPNPMNFDNAYLMIDENPCNPPPPVIDGCLKDMKVAVKCNPNGTYTLTLNGGSFTGTDITLTSQTPGVTVTPSQQPWSATTTWTLVGATSGQTVTLTANATKAGGGTAPDSDLCCSAEIKITMPDCPKPVGSLNVVKKVDNKTQANLTGYTYPVIVTCSAPANQSWPLVLTNGVPQTVSNIAIGSTCTAAEAPLPVPPNACPKGTVPMWLPPIYTPASVNISNGPPTTITVQNTLLCEDKPTGTLAVTKVVSPDSRGIGSTTQFPMTVTCTNPAGSYSLTVHGNTSIVPINVPVGSNCSIAETLPALPPGCTWQAPVYSPTTVTIGSGLSIVTVTNSYTCKILQIECRPPLIPNAAGTDCICPPGTVLDGKECVRRIDCRPPLIPNAAGTDCICPPGTVLDGKECVPRNVRDRKPIPNAADTARSCPPGTVRKGRECVPRERQLPSITLPGVKPHGDQRGDSPGSGGLPGRR
jgi:hypothetical protein